jgi:ketosteroid isomerase-like protein
MTADEWAAWRCKQDCAALYVAYANAVDFRDYDRVISLFTPDAVMHRMGAVLAGHAGIMNYLQNRPLTQVIRHVMTNIEIFPEEAEQARGLCYFVAFIEPGTDGATDLPMNGPAVMGEIHGTFRRMATEWKFSGFDARLTFIRAKA